MPAVSARRVVHCASYGGPYAGSFVPMLAGAARAAHGRGYEVTICFSEVARGRPWLEEISDLADIRFIDTAGSPSVFSQLRAVVEEGGARPTVLHTHFGAFDVPAALLGVMGRRRAVVWHAHGALTRRVRLRSRVYGTIFGRIVDAVLCVSPAIYDQALEMGYPRAKLHQMPNAIDLDRFSSITETEHSAARRRYGLAQAGSVVLHLGWDWLRKGGDLMLGAARLMEESDVAFLTVVEEDRQEPDAGLFETHQNVHRIAPQGAVNDLYAVADVFLSCSRSEGMPYALLESLARGLLVVGTDLPVQRELLEGLPGARLVPPEPRAISEALAALLELTPAQRSAHAAEARARVERSHALGPWAEQLVDVYDTALG